MMKARCIGRSVPLVLGFAAALAACGDDGGDDGSDDRTASAAGRVMLSPAGGVAGAHISLDQLNVNDAVGGVRMHIDDTITDADGRWSIPSGFSFNHGLFEVVASGGSFVDLMSGETIVLDPTDELRALFVVDLYEQRTGVLVSPVSNMTAAYARYQLSAGMHDNLQDAYEAAASATFLHYADVPWDRIDPAPLDQPASSATPAVRASLILGALNVMVDDIVLASGASHQEVHAFALTEAWTADLAAPPYDGNDSNNVAHGSGLQIGACEPLVNCTPRPGLACTLGECRELCDQWAGSQRSTLSGALLKIARSPLNQTGLSDTAILPIARALSDGSDTGLFADACRDSIDRTPPSVFFEAPTPADDAFVRDTISVRVRATDDIDMNPDLVFLGGLTDTDGDPTNEVATAQIATDLLPDGSLMVSAQATDNTGLMATASRSFIVDNTDPQITLAATGFYVQSTEWWTGNPTPTIGGTITEANLDAITVYADSVMVGTATASNGSWTMALPAGTIPGVAGAMIRVDALDRAGNSASVSQRIRYDATPPVIATPATAESTVFDESGDTVTFSDTMIVPSFGSPSYDPRHTHSASNPAVLGPATGCDASAPTVTKYSYLLDEQTPYASEASGPGPNGTNPIRWNMTISDDGVGVDYATVAYRIKDVASGTFPLDWTPLAGTGSYLIPLYRRAVSGPSIPVLGTKEGFFEIEFRGRDRLGRDAVGVTRCWNHKLLAAPIYVGPTTAAVTAPEGSGKYALASLRLEDTSSPFDPVSMMMNVLGAGQIGGAGLFQYLVVNPTNDPVYLSVDLQNPTSVTYSNSRYAGRWSHSSTSVTINCQFDPLDGGPDFTQPGCAPITNPGSGSTTPITTGGSIAPSTSYSVRVWEIAAITGAHSEVIPCIGCSTLPSTCMVGQSCPRTRVTVLLPPRGVDVVALPPRRFFVMPVLKPQDGLRPDGSGPYTEVTVSEGTVSGRVDETRIGCIWPTDYVQVSATRWNCTRRHTFRNLRYANVLNVSGLNGVTSYVYTGWNGNGASDPPHLPGTDGYVRSFIVPEWSTTEPPWP